MLDARRLVGPRAVGLLAGFVLLLHLPALGAFFVGDDFDFLRLIGTADGLERALKLHFWGEWEPVWYVTWWLDQSLWGFDPLGFRLQNAFWLAACVVGLFAMVRRCCPDRPETAWAVALLFAAHPLHDEAVAYLAARGHVMCLALMAGSLGAYLHARRPDASRRSVPVWIAVALLLAGLASLAKETALIVGAWIGVLEWLVVSRGRRPARALAAGSGAGALFLLPGAAGLALRRWVVGWRSDKLTGLAGDWAELVDDLTDDLPDYALLGTLPVPFGSLDWPVLDRFTPLGWFLVAAAFASGGWAAYRSATGRARSADSGLVALGLVIVLTGLAPVFWADLPLRRRYLFIPTAGIALMVGVFWSRLASWRPRSAAAVLAAVVLVCSVASVYRHEMYRRAGSMARDLIETARKAPIGEPPRVPERTTVVPLTMPARYGGDFLSGAYVVHHTDLRSALHLFGVPQSSLSYPLRFDHAEAMTVDVERVATDRLRVSVTFHHRAAFAVAMRDDPAERGRGRRARARRVSVDPESRSMVFEVVLDSTVLWSNTRMPYVSDGRFRAFED